MSRKYSKEMKIRACEDFLKGRKSRKQIALELNIGKHGTEKMDSQHFYVNLKLIHKD